MDARPSRIVAGFAQAAIVLERRFRSHHQIRALTGATGKQKNPRARSGSVGNGKVDKIADRGINCVQREKRRNFHLND
jgi:hypothetical protein